MYFTTTICCLGPQILNPAETFGDIIVDYSYVELTSACVTALLAFSKHYPGHRSREIKSALGRAEKFIRSIQRRDGSWWVGLLVVLHMSDIIFQLVSWVGLGVLLSSASAKAFCGQHTAVRSLMAADSGVIYDGLRIERQPLKVDVWCDGDMQNDAQQTRTVGCVKQFGCSKGL